MSAGVPKKGPRRKEVSGPPKSYTVKCKDCNATLGSVFRDPLMPKGEPAWFAEHFDGETAGLGPGYTRAEAALDLTCAHVCGRHYNE